MACANSLCVVLIRGRHEALEIEKTGSGCLMPGVPPRFWMRSVFSAHEIRKSREEERESIEFTQKVNCAEGHAGGGIGAEEYPG